MRRHERGARVQPKRVEVTIKLRLDTFDLATAMEIMQVVYKTIRIHPKVVGIVSVNIRKP